MPKNIKKVSKLSYRTLLLIGALLIIVASSVALYASHKPELKVSPRPKATINKLPEKTAANNGEKILAPSSQINQGNATDNHGANADVSTNPSMWTKSESGAVVLKQPLSNGSIKSGDLMIGSASVDKVQYRLIDDQLGVVSQGFVSVVNDSFSAAIHFSSHSSSGRLDVFSTTDGGTEINEVQVPVTFHD
jgi:hypothetical protein